MGQKVETSQRTVSFLFSLIFVCWLLIRQVIPNIIYGSAEDERRRARNGHAHSNGHAHAHAHGIPHSAGTSSSTNGSTTGTTTSERSTGGSGSGSNADLIAGGGGGPSSSGSGSPSNSSTRSGSGSTSSQQQAQAQAMLQDSPPQQGQGERNDALGLFMESPEARAVIKATEPFDFICVNKVRTRILFTFVPICIQIHLFVYCLPVLIRSTPSEIPREVQPPGRKGGRFRLVHPPRRQRSSDSQ